VPPKALAALFEAVARIDGLTVEENVQDGAGRTGVGVRWSRPGGYAGTLVFDARTHVFLGTDMSAVIQRGIVDQVGQRP
jgi:hypothetical protein